MTFRALGSLISKNMKMFFRSKISASAVILIPLLVVMLAGFAFDSSELSNIKIGVYSSEYTEFTNSVIVDFEGKGFSSARYDNSESCINSVRHSETQICIIFPAGLNPDINAEDIVFYADYSRVNLASELVTQIQKSIGIRTSAVSEGLAQDLIDTLESIKSTLPDNAEKISDAIDDAENNYDLISSLDFPVGDVEDAIKDLEDIKADVNDTSIENDIQTIIDDLQDVNESGHDFSDNIDSINSEQDQLLSSLSAASVSLNKLIAVLNGQREISASSVVSPIKTRIEPVTLDSNSKDYMVPIMLALIALFGSILLSSTMILKEKKTKAFFRNFMAPVNNVMFILATYLTCMFILFIQFVFIVIGIEWVLDMNIVPILGPLSLVLFAALSVFVGLGMLIGYLFRSEETVIFSSMIIASLLMFFSNAILPLENISSGIMNILKYSPLVLSSEAIKKIMLFRLGYGSVAIELLILGAFFLVFFTLNCALRRMTSRIKQSS